MIDNEGEVDHCLVAFIFGYAEGGVWIRIVDIVYIRRPSDSLLEEVHKSTESTDSSSSSSIHDISSVARAAATIAPKGGLILSFSLPELLTLGERAVVLDGDTEAVEVKTL